MSYPLHQKMKFSIKDLFSKCDQICSFLRIWSHLLKKSLMENFIFRAVTILRYHALKGWNLLFRKIATVKTFFNEKLNNRWGIWLKVNVYILSFLALRIVINRLINVFLKKKQAYEKVLKIPVVSILLFSFGWRACWFRTVSRQNH